MERESFENPDIAALMNEHFVNIKVDREERPDLDQIYMSAVMAMTGHGGWPMSVFLTPELKPFFGGTYFPPTDSRGMAGFPRVLSSVHQAWQERRDEIIESAAEMTEQLRAFGTIPKGSGALDVKLLDQAARDHHARTSTRSTAASASAPKFPHPMDLKVLLRHHARTGDSPGAARRPAHARQDGPRRHLRPPGRRLRPLLDRRPLAGPPLRENALRQCALDLGLSRSLPVDPRRRLRPRRPRDDGLRPRPDDRPRGGVLFDRGRRQRGRGREVLRLVARRGDRSCWAPDRAKTFCYVYDVTEQGNWEEHNILNLPRTIGQAAKLLGRDEDELRDELAASRAKLLAVRERRVPPAKDTKVLVSWNGLMIAALAEGGRILKDERYLEAARRAAGFILDRMRRDDGRLLHTYKDGQAKLDAYLDDYADLIDGLTRLYEATGEPRWIESALELARIMIDEFADAEQGGFFFTGSRHEALIARQKDVHDNATPSGNGMAATALVRLGALTGRDDLTAGRPIGTGIGSARARAPAGRGRPELDRARLPPGLDPRIRRDRRRRSRRVPRGPGSHRDAVPTAQGRRPGHARAGGRRSPRKSRCSPIARPAMAGPRPMSANTSPAASRSSASRASRRLLLTRDLERCQVISRMSTPVPGILSLPRHDPP